MLIKQTKVDRRVLCIRRSEDHKVKINESVIVVCVPSSIVEWRTNIDKKHPAMVEEEEVVVYPTSITNFGNVSTAVHPSVVAAIQK